MLFDIGVELDAQFHWICVSHIFGGLVTSLVTTLSINSWNCIRNEKSFNKSWCLLVQFEVRLLIFRIYKILDQHWYILEVAVDIFDIQLKESVGILSDFISATGKENCVEITPIFGHYSKAFLVDDGTITDRTDRKLSFKLLETQEIAFQIVSGYVVIQVLCPRGVIINISELDGQVNSLR